MFTNESSFRISSVVFTISLIIIIMHISFIGRTGITPKLCVGIHCDNTIWRAGIYKFSLVVRFYCSDGIKNYFNIKFLVINNISITMSSSYWKPLKGWFIFIITSPNYYWCMMVKSWCLLTYFNCDRFKKFCVCWIKSTCKGKFLPNHYP